MYIAVSDPSVASFCMSHSNMCDVPSYDGSDSGSGEEEQHNAWDQMLFTLEKEQPDDTIVFARGRVTQGGIVVPIRAGRSAYVHGVVSR